MLLEIAWLAANNCQVRFRVMVIAKFQRQLLTDAIAWTERGFQRIRRKLNRHRMPATVRWSGAGRPNGGSAGFGRARSVILVFANGGQSQIDTWDPKPAAPDNVRGEFAPIATALPGANFCEHLPQTARIADRLTVIR